MSSDTRFWAKVSGVEPLGCWEWTASLTPKGYGQFYVRERGGPEHAHRVAWRLLRGDIPVGLEVDHLCANRCCVNPWHMELVTASVNTRRMLARVYATCKRGHSDWATNGGRARTCRTCRNERKLAAYHARKGK
jgi:hypothetical protein